MQAQMTAQIAALRRFNRFYTHRAGLLGEALFRSGYSLTEARILYELAHLDKPTATELKRSLGLDAGYLSRILKRFAERGLVARTAVKGDRRSARLALTDAGRTTVALLERAAEEHARKALAPLPPRARDGLVASMQRIERALDGTRDNAAPFTLRPPRVGDIGWIAHRQGILYAQEYGWDATYEALASEILAQFVRAFDPARERGWIAERNGVVVGSVFVVRKSKTVAKLRLLYVEPSARGLGIGRRLVDECIAFARERGYRTMTLWTQSNLTSARAIYEKAGFRLVAKEKHHSFGKDLVGETWELAL